MQTLEINYKSIFEALPGKNILLLPDAPHFTITAITDSYLEVSRHHRDQVVGRGVFGFLSEVYPELENAAGSLSDSFQYVLLNKKSHTLDLPLPTGSGKKHRRFLSNPVISADHEVLFIILKISKVKGISIQNGESETHIVEAEIEKRFHHILLQAPVAMAVARGPDMVLEIANDHMLELWGKGKEIVGLPILKALPEIRNQPFPDLLRHVYFSQTEYYGFETKAFVTRSGIPTECYFNFVYTPLKNPEGRVTGIMMVASEVTNMVMARKELEESEKRYRDLIAKATVATAIYYGEDMEIRLANEAMLRLWGKDSSVIGKTLKEAIPELDGQPFHELLRHVFATGETYHSSEDRADLFVNGKLQSFYFNFTYKALRDTEGKIYGVLNMAVDVSQIVKAKMKIKDAEERWRMALHSADLGTWDYYPQTRKFYCSNRTKELYGISESEEPSFEKLLEAIHPKDRERVLKEIGKGLKGSPGGAYQVDYQITALEDKKERWLRASGQAVYNSAGIAYRLTGTVLDITERKQIEEALEERVQLRTKELLEANKELERSNQELEQYAYVASHDLQEPLRKILVYTDLLKVNTAHFSAPEQLRLEKIMSSAVRMSHLIQDLLNFSRLLKTENQFTQVDLNMVIRNARDDFELRLQETGAVLRADTLPVINGSEHQLNQLFYNLISNALKFRRTNVTPVISISASLLTNEEMAEHPQLSQELQYYNISVADNGIGFNTKYSKQIFEIFKRLHTRARYEGTGIGLALCRKIVRNHRGDIYADSMEGEGSVFHVLLPLMQPG